MAKLTTDEKEQRAAFRAHAKKMTPDERAAMRFQLSATMARASERNRWAEFQYDVLNRLDA